MTDTPMEGGQVAGGQESPTLQPSPTPTPTPSPGGGDALETVSKRLADLESQVRSLQSGKDKGIASIGREVKGLKEQIAKYEEYRRLYGNERALREMEIDELIATRGSDTSRTQVPPTDAQGSASQAASADHTALLQGLGLEPNSAEVTAVLREAGDYASKVTRFVQLAEAKRQAQARPPNAAQVVPAGGSGQAVEPPDAEKLGQDLEKLMQRGLRSPEDHKQFTALQSQLEKALRQAGSG